VERACSAGVLRAEFTTEDIVVLVMANAGLVERAHGITAEASARLVHVLLNGFRSTDATDGPSAPKPGPDEPRHAMQRRTPPGGDSNEALTMPFSAFPFRQARVQPRRR
jgi:hypothetical protein